MDKHFQDLLHLTKANSAWVQNGPVFWLHADGSSGRFPRPENRLQRRHHFRPDARFRGRIFGSCPTTHFTILGVSPRCLRGGYGPHCAGNHCVVIPYTTVLVPEKEYGTFPRLISRSLSMAWAGFPGHTSLRFSFMQPPAVLRRRDKTLYIPYLIIAVFVLVLAAVFWKSKLPEIKTQDDYHTDQKGPDAPTEKARQSGPRLSADAYRREASSFSRCMPSCIS